MDVQNNTATVAKEDIYRLLCILEHRWARAAALVHGATLVAREGCDDLSPSVLELLNLAAEDLEDRSGLQRIRAAIARGA